MQTAGRWAGLVAIAVAGLSACGGGSTRADAGGGRDAGPDGSAMDATPGDARPSVDVAGPVDLGTGADGFSTWQPGSPLPPVEHLVTAVRVDLGLSYFNAATRVERVSNARSEGVSYYFNFADALGRYVYITRPGCAFDDFRVYKVATAGESSGPVAVSDMGVATVDVVLSNPRDARLAPLTEADLPPGAAGPCRALDQTSFEYEGLALVRHVTVGVRVYRTAARCEVYCTAQGDASPGCRSTCLAAPLPFTGQITFDLDPSLALTATRPPGGTLTYRREANTLEGTASLIVN